MPDTLLASAQFNRTLKALNGVRPHLNFGNLFVQVEVDRFETPEGPKTIRSLNIYEMKDGKRWREWKFYPNA